MTELKAFLSSINRIDVESIHLTEISRFTVEYERGDSELVFRLVVEFGEFIEIERPFIGEGERFIKSKNITRIDEIILNGDKIKFNQNEALSLFNDILLNKIYLI